MPKRCGFTHKNITNENRLKYCSGNGVEEFKETEPTPIANITNLERRLQVARNTRRARLQQNGKSRTNQ